MTWFVQLRRRLSALFGWLRRPGQATTAQLSLPSTPLAQPTSAVPRAANSSESVSAASVSSAAASVQAARSVIVGPAASHSAVVVAAPPVVGPAVVVAPVIARRARPRAPTLDPNLGQLKARQFFARMIAATPAGLTIDFTEWQSASVERFFMAMTSPGLTRRREAPTSGVEQLSLTNAFQGFEWD